MSTARFAVGSPDGPLASVWRLWTNKHGDVFIADRFSGGFFKVSLHASGRWRMALTKEFAEKSEYFQNGNEDRAFCKWTRREFSPGLTRAVQIVTYGVDVDSPPSRVSSGKVAWMDAPSRGEVGYFDIFLSKLHEGEEVWPGRTAMGTELVYKTPLTTGEELFVVWHKEATSPDAWAIRHGAVSSQKSPEVDESKGEYVYPRTLSSNEANGVLTILDLSSRAVAEEGQQEDELWQPVTDEPSHLFDRKILTQLARPTGTVDFHYILDEPLSEPPKEDSVLLQTPIGFKFDVRILINPNFDLVFMWDHNSVRVNVKPLAGALILRIFFVWGNSEMRLHVGAPGSGPLLGNSSMTRKTGF